MYLGVVLITTLVIVTSSNAFDWARRNRADRMAKLTASRQNNLAELKSYFRCPTCNPELCPSPYANRLDCEPVKELGVCACCMVCALRDGQPCGVFTEPCGAGLKCSTRDTQSGSVETLFYGDGLCRIASSAAGRDNDGNFLLKPDAK